MDRMGQGGMGWVRWQRTSGMKWDTMGQDGWDRVDEMGWNRTGWMGQDGSRLLAVLSVGPVSQDCLLRVLRGTVKMWLVLPPHCDPVGTRPLPLSSFSCCGAAVCAQWPGTRGKKWARNQPP